MRGFVVSLCVVGASMLFAGCDEDLSTVTGPTPNLETTFSSIQRDIFNSRDLANRQACIECHTDVGKAPSGQLVLLEGRSYSQLVGRGSAGKAGATLVIPNDPDNSYIVHKLEGTADIAGQRMPRGSGPFLTPGQLMVIRRWIELGALNN